jgi:PDDEXK-like domain of unknown function (DUF3799)
MTLPPVRHSRLKLIGKSPKHFREAVTKETSTMGCGSAVHSLVLGGQRVTSYPGPVRRGKEYEAFAAANENALILTRTEYEKVMPMADAVLASPLAAPYLKGRKEVEVNWSFLGRDCQSHMDMLADDWTSVADLKSCESADPGQIKWKAARYCWFSQLAFYSEAVMQLGHARPEEHVIVAVESASPYPVTVMRLTARALEHGQKQWRLWFERLLACEASGSWPAYCESVVDLDAPSEEIELTYAPEEVAA